MSAIENLLPIVLVGGAGYLIYEKFFANATPTTAPPPPSSLPPGYSPSGGASLPSGVSIPTPPGQQVNPPTVPAAQIHTATPLVGCPADYPIPRPDGTCMEPGGMVMLPGSPVKMACPPNAMCATPLVALNGLGDFGFDKTCTLSSGMVNPCGAGAGNQEGALFDAGCPDTVTWFWALAAAAGLALVVRNGGAR